MHPHTRLACNGNWRAHHGAFFLPLPLADGVVAVRQNCGNFAIDYGRHLLPVEAAHGVHIDVKVAAGLAFILVSQAQAIHRVGKYFLFNQLELLGLLREHRRAGVLAGWGFGAGRY